MDTTDNNIVKFRLATFIAIIVAIFSFSFSVAGFYFSTGSLNDKIKALEKSIEKKIEASDLRMVEEVGGLRSDWERRNNAVEKRLDKLEKK